MNLYLPNQYDMEMRIYHIRNISAIRNILYEESAKVEFLTSTLDYGNLLLYGLSKIIKLLLVQNTAASVVIKGH